MGLSNNLGRAIRPSTAPKTIVDVVHEQSSQTLGPIRRELRCQMRLVPTMYNAETGGISTKSNRLPRINSRHHTTLPRPVVQAGQHAGLSEVFQSVASNKFTPTILYLNVLSRSTSRTLHSTKQRL
jgi:hypothetical protein